MSMNFIHGKILALVVGNIAPPISNMPDYRTGPIMLVTNIIRLIFVAAGIYAFVNLIIAGFQFMTAGGDSKAIEKAWGRIWQSLLGLIIIVGSFALAALFGKILFGNAGFILNPQIYGPGP